MFQEHVKLHKNGKDNICIYLKNTKHSKVPAMNLALHN